MKEGARIAMHKSLCLVLKAAGEWKIPDSFISRLLHFSEYKMALEAAKVRIEFFAVGFFFV
jgi:hypothetical protein